MIAPSDQALAPVKSTADVNLAHSQQMLSAVKAVPITSQAAVDWAAKAIQELAAQHKAMKKECESVAKPLRDAARRVSQWWKPGLTACNDAMNHLKKGIQIYRAEEARKAQAALAQCPTHEEVQRAQQAILTTPQGLAEREDWTWRVIDETQIPRQYWVLDQTAISKVVKAMKDKTQIPGIEAVRETKMVRTGK